MTRVLLLNLNIIKIKILIFIINVDKYLPANIFKFYFKFLNTQNFDLSNLAIFKLMKLKLLIYWFD